jgi:hypothetical protein
MNKLLHIALVAGQYLCNSAAVVLTIFLLVRWNQERDLNPSFDGFNPWFPGLVLLALGAVFKLARKGLAAKGSNRED